MKNKKVLLRVKKLFTLKSLFLNENLAIFIGNCNLFLG